MTRAFRFILVSIYRLLYRTNVRGLENVPDTGGALLVSNHQSFLDAMVIGATIDRPVRFLIHRKMYNHPLVWPLARAFRSIPIDGFGSPRELIVSLREASRLVGEGELVCIFPEGQLTRTGHLLPFKRGMERIMRDRSEPVIPFCIDGLIDSWWGRHWGRMRLPRPRLHRRQVEIYFGRPRPGDTPAPRIRQDVALLLSEAFEARRPRAIPLHRLALRSLRRDPLGRRYTDHTQPRPIANYKVLAAIAVLGGKLTPHWKEEKAVGILLPPAVGSMAINVAALLGGRVPVNLNYTVGPDTLLKICENGRIRLIITSREFVAKARLRIPEGLEVIHTEDIRAGVTGGDRIRGILQGMFLPVAVLERRFGRRRRARLDDVATLIYSSGSTGVPKGVMLTHWNIFSNMLAICQVVDVGARDRLMGVLPFFHSFGYTVAIWLPFQARVKVSYYPNPLDAHAIGQIAKRDGVTILFGTPTFFSTYARRLMGGEFGSIRLAVAGAEKLRGYIADAFQERFGIEPREGFGCTETSPVVSINCDDFRAAGIYQKGTRKGTIGLPIPGVCTRIVDIETGRELAEEETGMLQVRGPNVMKGYHRMRDRTEESITGGWYITGDVAKIDEDGFITITDRLARFSKIGGEMVPHIQVEQALHNALGLKEQVFAVTAVPDERKGERLAVLYTNRKEEARKALEGLGEHGIPSIWQPRMGDFLAVDEIPLLGSGKMDLKKLKAIAMEELGGDQAGG